MRARGTSSGATGSGSAEAEDRLEAGSTAETRFATVLSDRAALEAADEPLVVPPELRALLEACHLAGPAGEVLFEEVDSATPQPVGVTPTGGGTPDTGSSGELEALPDLPELAESQPDGVVR